MQEKGCHFFLYFLHKKAEKVRFFLRNPKKNTNFAAVF